MISFFRKLNKASFIGAITFLNKWLFPDTVHASPLENIVSRIIDCSYWNENGSYQI